MRQTALDAADVPPPDGPPEAAAVLVMHAVPLLAAGIAATLAPACAVATLAPMDEEGGLPARLFDTAARRRLLLVADHAGGLAAAAQLPGLPVVIVQAGVRAWSVRQALQAGVQGYVSADGSLHELQAAVASVLRGHRHLCPAASACMADSVVQAALTPREMDVLQLLGDGLDNKTISLRLDIALGTVKSHVKAVLDKLGASSRTQAVAAGHARGLVVAGAGLRSLAAGHAADRSQRHSLRSRPLPTAARRA